MRVVAMFQRGTAKWRKVAAVVFMEAEEWGTVIFQGFSESVSIRDFLVWATLECELGHNQTALSLMFVYYSPIVVPVVSSETPFIPCVCLLNSSLFSHHPCTWYSFYSPNHCYNNNYHVQLTEDS